MRRGLLLARTGLIGPDQLCPFIEEDWKSLAEVQTDAIDPERTFGLVTKFEISSEARKWARVPIRACAQESGARHIALLYVPCARYSYVHRRNGDRTAGP